MEITRELAESLREFFNARVDVNGPFMPGMLTNCHVWVGNIASTGYGRLVHKRKEILAHRLAWVLKHGPIPNGIFVLHECDYEPCVRHIFLGTPQDNMTDKTLKGRQAKGVGAGLNKLTGLTDDDVIEDSQTPGDRNDARRT